jgi:uncharacterized caspase-like protein
MGGNGNYHLVTIAIDDYKEHPSLSSPVYDAKAIEDVLKRIYGFGEDHSLHLFDRDATNRNIIRLLHSLQDLPTEDTLILYYAGHGTTDVFDRMNFWLPYDAGQDMEDRVRWLPSQTIIGAMRKCRCQHILLLNDCCFSGDFIGATRDVIQKSPGYREVAKQFCAREVITSGMSEVVADSFLDGHSPFAWHLLYGLRNHQDDCVDTDDLFQYVKRGVKGQRPLHRVLPEAGHQDGGLVLLYRRSASREQMAESVVFSKESYKEAELRKKIERYKNCKYGFIDAVRNDESPEVLNYMVEMGFNVNETEEHHMSALWFALFETKNIDTFNVLISLGTDVDMISKMEIDDHIWEAPILLYAIGKDRADIVRIVLESGADPNLAIQGEITIFPLMYAAMKGNANIVRMLLKHGADVYAKDSEGDTAIEWARSFDRAAVVQMLKEQAAVKHSESKFLARTAEAIYRIFGPE